MHLYSIQNIQKKKKKYTLSNRCENQAHPWSQNEIMEFRNFGANKKAK